MIGRQFYVLLVIVAIASALSIAHDVGGFINAVNANLARIL